MKKRCVLFLLCLICLTALVSCSDGAGMFDRIIVVRGDVKAKFVVPHKINYLEEYVTDHPYSTDSKFTMANNGLDVGTPYIIYENELDGDIFDLYYDVIFQNPICEETAKGRKIGRTLIVYAKLAEPEE